MKGFGEAAMSRLMAHPWRGNIRELENVVERCMLFCDGERIEVEHLPPETRQQDGAGPAAEVAAGLLAGGSAELGGEDGVGLKDVVKQATAKLEKQLIERALEQTGGNVTHAARLLKISRKSLQTKMKELGLRDD